jgi:hypothetical protein
MCQTLLDSALGGSPALVCGTWFSTIDPLSVEDVYHSPFVFSFWIKVIKTNRELLEHQRINNIQTQLLDWNYNSVRDVFITVVSPWAGHGEDYTGSP